MPQEYFWIKMKKQVILND